MSLDVQEGYPSEDFLGRPFDERSIFPTYSEHEALVLSGVGRRRTGLCIIYQSTKNMMGTAVAKKPGSTCSQLRIPCEEFGHQSMYWVNMEEMAIHMARVTG